MALDQERPRVVLQKLNRNLSKLANQPTADNIHQFRTYSRRLQALLEELALDLGKNDKKLHKLISRLRKRAGRLRDLDVQIAALRTLKIPDQDGRKAQLQRVLSEARAKREKKLLKAFDQDTVRELHKRLQRTARSVEVRQDADPLALAMRLFARQAQDHSPLTEDRLHQYRLTGKRVRYLVEFAASTPETEAIIVQLKHMQDALGDWHDWLTLTQNAAKRLGEAQDCALLVALRNLTRAKFRRAVEVVMQTRTALAGKPSRMDAPRRTPTAALEAPRAAIA
jgi:CHAD domain-containing protein